MTNRPNERERNAMDPMALELERMWSEHVMDEADREDTFFEGLGIQQDRLT